MISTHSGPKPEVGGPKPDLPAPKPDPGTPPSGRAGVIRDGWLRLAGIPFFGLVIPRFTGLLGKLGPGDPLYWVGTVYFIAVAGLIWQGNRWLLFKQRLHLDWFQRPILKLLLLVAANIVYTAPLTMTLCWAWLRFIAAPFPMENWVKINLATSYVVIAVIFVTHAYETVFLIKERESDQLQLAMVERARLAAELETMKAQLAPHFLFNCLNTLAALIERQPALAATFNQHLADVCRYLLLQKNRDLVPLDDELAFFDSYVALTRLRFPRSILVARRDLDDPAVRADLLVPPASLQLLLENAIKHNQFSEANPLPVEIRLEGDALVVSNPLRPKSTVLPSTGTGLFNLRERVQLVSGATLLAEAVDGCFRVRLPIVRLAFAPQSPPSLS
jgi:hypothetical protein